MLRWSEPPEVRSPSDIINISDHVERADAAHQLLKRLDDYRGWLVRARAEAIAASYFLGTSYAALGQRWGVGAERVRQMMFQSGNGRSGWVVGQDVRPRRSTPKPLPFGRVHAMRPHGDPVAACGLTPVHSLGADFTSTIYPVCETCRDRVRSDIDVNP